MADAISIIPAAVLRNLSDKLYEKRKTAAYEVEGIVKQLTSVGDHDKISGVIKLLANDFAYSPQVNNRKGGLIGLAAITVGLSSEAAQHLEQIIPPVINSFSDQDSRVRYYACEALYNIAKIVRGESIIHFNSIFDALCKLSADSDPNVQNAAHLLDRLVKDIVSESDQFSIDEFIPLLRERMNFLNPHVRQFLVGWITVLDSVPDIDMLGFLPDFLDGLFNMLSDPSREIRQQADSALSEFLLEIQNSPVSCEIVLLLLKSVDYGRMAEILVLRASSPDDFTRWTAITWINELVKLGGYELVPFYADILGAILPCLADNEEKIRVVASEINDELRATEADTSQGFAVGAILSVAKRSSLRTINFRGGKMNEQLSSEYEATRIESLHWISALLNRHRPEVLSSLNDIFETLLKALSDISDEVMYSGCFFSCRESSSASGFGDAERVYRELSTILEGEADLGYASTLVQALNLILLTSSELTGLRDLLKLSLYNASGKDFFLSLYASSVVQSLTEEDINVRFLVQLDKLIHLLETPIFAYLRLQLLEPGRYIWLLKALYGLLMLLPQQSAAFKILRTRLKTVPSYSFKREKTTHALSDNNVNEDPRYLHSGIDFASWLERFEQMQKQHRVHLKSRILSHNSSISSKDVTEVQISEENKEPLNVPDMSRSLSRLSFKGP
ncbi:protein VAC14 [Tanacetum coccineum]